MKINTQNATWAMRSMIELEACHVESAQYIQMAWIDCMISIRKTKMVGVRCQWMTWKTVCALLLCLLLPKRDDCFYFIKFYISVFFDFVPRCKQIPISELSLPS